MRACAALCLMLATSVVLADWLDDMPSVDEVAAAVREQNREDAPRYRASDGFRSVNGLPSGPRRFADDDPEWYAARLAGTFEMLRWQLLFEALYETNPAVPSKWRPLSEPRSSTLERAAKIGRQYREFELALLSGVGKRPGYAKSICDRPDTFLNRFGQKMGTRQECYQEQFHLNADLQHVKSYRMAIFPRLFCHRGEYYQSRYEEYFNYGNGVRAGYWDRPHNYVFKRIRQEQWPQVAPPQATEQVCTAYGGDKDGNGICDAWQAALKSKAVAATNIKCALCPDPAPSGVPPYSSIVSATWDASKEALTRSSVDGAEWGGYVYPVQGGFRYLAPVSSGSTNMIDFAATADPALAQLFRSGKPVACRQVATYHTHPDAWSISGLSLGDMKTAISTGTPSYVMKAGKTETLYVFEPGRSADADEAIMDADPWDSIPGVLESAELYYNTRYVDALTEQ